ncbi:marine proteobacterial sortase target protein [Thalassomonas sp. M1454]|uniref:marine proteobacterial sortase target protein n=1 Tax=Thalassomonas sp. M1454 TaxID=2594477 RepID=UPI00117E70BC|nr:marine proteobacterial sortase target protein [Thalassomonas sp. M1454]TRX53846.1 marine proteobacterial sortase target protein [Thalassomonas sp. M1454]
MSLTPIPKTILIKKNFTIIFPWLCYLALGQSLLMSFMLYANASDFSSEPLPQKIELSGVSSGSLFLKNQQGYQNSLVLSTDYSVDVNGLMARTNLVQSFKNTSNDWMEGVYVFPLTEGVAVDALEMHIGEQIIVGEIKERKQAKKIYQKAKSAGKKASLLEQERSNLFTTSIANIPPGETVKIKISYLHALPLIDGQFSLRLPLTITPRYIPKESVELSRQKQQVLRAEQVTKLVEANNENININQGTGWSVNTKKVVDASRITPPQIHQQQAQQASIRVNLNVGLAITDVKSLYHQVKRQANKVMLASKHIAMDRDFVLTWSIANESIPNGAFFKETKDGYDYGLVMLNPPKLARTAAKMPKEMIYIIDTSGSMAGEAIRQAKRALDFAIKQLEPQDLFNIIEFNSTYSTLYSQPQLASAANVAQSIHWINQLRADGGTEMLPALNAALGHHSKPGFIRQVVFITDGSVGNETELFTVINNKLFNSRLHTVGIGSAPNSHFMQRSAQLGRGTFSYIGDVSEVRTKMTELFSKINQPLLTDIKVNWPSKNVELLPQRIADLYAGEPLMISARWPSTSQGEVVIKGNIIKRQWQQSLALNQVNQHSGIATWWARQKIKQLNYKLHKSNDLEQKQQLIDSITLVALEHNILSKYTSLVAVEKQPSRKVNEYLKQQSVANAMPKGSLQSIPLAQTATSAKMQLLVGLILMLMTAIYILVERLIFKNKAELGNDE